MSYCAKVLFSDASFSAWPPLFEYVGMSWGGSYHHSHFKPLI